MKLKLFFLSIFVFLSLVAYQKYSEYSTLKSINSYDSCAAAKGSVIQESYPATCVTRLGSRFTQPTPVPSSMTPPPPTISGWKKYLDYSTSHTSFNFEYPSFMSDPTTDAQRMESYMSSGYFPNNISLRVTGPYPDTSSKELIGWIKERGWPSQEGEVQEMAGVSRVLYRKLDGTRAVQSTFIETGVKYPRSWVLYFKNKNGVYRIDLDTPGTEEELAKYQAIFPHILSTFKFTN